MMQGFDGSTLFSNGSHSENQSMDELFDRELGSMLANGHSFQEQSTGGEHLCQNQPSTNGSVSTSFVDFEDDCEFSDGVLRYIDQMLMEEEMEDKTHMIQESSDFQAKERSFYEVLGQKYPPSPDNNNYSYVNNDHNSTVRSNGGTGNLFDIVDPSLINTSSTDYEDCSTNYAVSNSSVVSSSPNHLTSVVHSESWDFVKGIGGASMFLPNASRILDINDVLDQNLDNCEINVENDNEVTIENSHLEERGKKNRHADENGCEDERSRKLPVVYPETYNPPIEEFDDVLLYTVGERERKFEAYRTNLRNASSNSVGKNVCDGSKSRSRRKIQGVDLTSLLIDCAKSIAADDHHAADELLRKVRRNSSPLGDGGQRLAHYFADGLEARLAGTGSHIHKALVAKRTTVSDYLRAYYTCIASCPYFTISNFVSNKVIMSKSEKAMRVHIIDFGILYGFQWPSFIQRLAEREGGSPKLRITGIDYPQPGFRPAERIEDTGRHLARYAEMFNVPFEYNAIAKKWETIKIEDLKIEKGEFVAVSCMYRADNLQDETLNGTGAEESPRNMVLNLIRKINPDIFVHGIVNGAYGVPYFVTRFREALFRFSAVYDMLEANIPRESPERMLIEKGVFGKEALNVIACEGWERVERPETYKQWQLRHLRAGFMPRHLGKNLTDSAVYKVRKFYDGDFVIDVDKQWLLMGWKGRIIYAMSCWQPSSEGGV